MRRSGQMPKDWWPVDLGQVQVGGRDGEAHVEVVEAEVPPQAQAQVQVIEQTMMEPQPHLPPPHPMHHPPLPHPHMAFMYPPPPPFHSHSPAPPFAAPQSPGAGGSSQGRGSSSFGNGMPSYEEMLVMAISDLREQDGSTPKSCFEWMLGYVFVFVSWGNS